VHTGFGVREGRRPLRRFRRRRRVILKRIFNEWDGSVNWINLAENRDGWQALVNAVFNCGFHKVNGVP
jgi:hypothetical protein